LPGVLAEANSHTASKMERNPGCSSHGIDQGILDRPITDRVGTVQHAFRFAIGGGD
jgi:hypothetical protein